LWSADLDAEYGTGDIDACLGLAGLELARAGMLGGFEQAQAQAGENAH
jgi:hypothetical protein